MPMISVDDACSTSHHPICAARWFTVYEMIKNLQDLSHRINLYSLISYQDISLETRKER